jgi:hypothetical protein
MAGLLKIGTRRAALPPPKYFEASDLELAKGERDCSSEVNSSEEPGPLGLQVIEPEAKGSYGVRKLFRFVE